MLEAVRGRLAEAGMSPGGGAGAGKKSERPGTRRMLSTIALFRKLLEGTDGDLFLDPTELRKVS